MLYISQPPEMDFDVHTSRQQSYIKSISGSTACRSPYYLLRWLRNEQGARTGKWLNHQLWPEEPPPPEGELKLWPEEPPPKSKLLEDEEDVEYVGRCASW